MTLFKNKYRIESTRLRGWDYSAAGYYFVTFCTYHREPCLGHIVDDDVLLSRSGEIVAEEWNKTEQIRPNVRLDEWIIMPNHVHGIIVITHHVETGRRPVSTHDEDNHVETGRRPVSTHDGDNHVETGRRPVSTHDGDNHVETGRRPVSTTHNIQPHSLSSIVGQIKSISTKRIRLLGDTDFRWQERFYDRIIRDEESLLKARAYIIGNPSKWMRDKENAPGVFM